MNRKLIMWLVLGVMGCGTYGLGLWAGQHVDRLVRPPAGAVAAPGDLTESSGTAVPAETQSASSVRTNNHESAFLAVPGTELLTFEDRVMAMETSGSWDLQLIPLIHSLQTHEYPAAWTLIAGSHARQQVDFLQRELVRVWARKDPQSALAAVLALPDSTTRDARVDDVLLGWASSDPDSALDWVRQLPAGSRRESALGTLITGLARVDPLRANLLLTELPPGRARAASAELVIASLVEIDIEAATQLLEELDAMRTDNHALSTVAGARARQNVEQAVEWALARESPRDRETALRAVVQLLVIDQDQPGLAAELILSRTDGELRGRLAETLAELWAAHDVEGAAEWVGQLQDPMIRRLAWKGLRERWARDDPEAAANYARAFLQDSESRSSALREIAFAWSRVEEDEQAVRWADELPPGSDRDAFVSTLCTELARHSPRQAAELALSITAGAERTEVLRRTLQEWAIFGDPAEAAVWSANIRENATRAEALSDALRTWSARDPVASAEWLREQAPE